MIFVTVFKIKYKLYIASESAPPPPSKKFYVCMYQSQLLIPNYYTLSKLCKYLMNITWCNFWILIDHSLLMLHVFFQWLNVCCNRKAVNCYKEIVIIQFFMQLYTLWSNLIPILTESYLENLLCYATEYGDPISFYELWLWTSTLCSRFSLFLLTF
jgi:hypothetical protein